MAASNQTNHYALPQWEANDPVLRTDFNAAFAAIDDALAALAAGVAGRSRVATGSYTGTGTFGASNPTTLSFPFTPQLVVVAPTDAGYSSMNRLVALRGNTKVRNSTGDDSGDNYRIPLTWSGNGLSWYSSDAWSQLNQQGTVYLYFAVG